MSSTKIIDLKVYLLISGMLIYVKWRLVDKMVDVLFCRSPTELWKSRWEDISIYISQNPSPPAIVDTAIRVCMYSMLDHLKIFRKSYYIDC